MSSDIYPQSAHVRDFGLQSAPDWAVWGYAAKADYTIVTNNGDFSAAQFPIWPSSESNMDSARELPNPEDRELLRACGHKIELFHLADEQSFLSLG
jgi:hypothetical protein